MQKYAPVQNVFWFYRRKYIQNGFSSCVKNIRCCIENATLVTMHKQEIRKNGKPMHKELTKNAGLYKTDICVCVYSCQFGTDKI